MKFLYVTTVSNTINAFLVPHIKMLIDKGHQVDIACNITTELNPLIDEMGCKVHHVEFSRNPFSINNILAYKKIKKIINRENYSIIHTHTPNASAIVRLACRKNKKIKIVYTAHGFHFYKGAPLKNWLIFFPVEFWLSKFTDTIITINQEDYIRAKHLLRPNKVEYMPGVGVDIRKIHDVKVDKLRKIKEIGLPEDAFILLSVGELNRNKNHEVIIKSLARLKDSRVHYVICGSGNLKTKLENLAKKLDVSAKVHLLGHRSDIYEFYKIANVFVFPSFREGLSVALMEAMACGLPVVCSDIRGNRDLISHNNGGYLIKPNDIDGFCEAINAVIRGEARNFGKYNKNIVKKFETNSVLEKLEGIYSKVCETLEV